MKRIIVATGMLAIACACFGLEPPAPAPTKPVQKPETSAGQNDKDADRDGSNPTAAPAGVVVSPTFVLQPAASDEAEHKENYASAEWGLVWVTSVLVLATIGLMIYTARLWWATTKLASDARDTAKQQAADTEESLRISRQAAEAAARNADISEKALVPVQRAYVFVTIHMKEFRVPHTKGSPATQTRAWASFRNHGKTPAILVKLGTHIATYDGYPSEFPKPVVDRTIPEGLVIGAGKRFRYHFTEDLDTMRPDDPIRKKLLCLGVIEYKDVFGTPHKTGYCWEYQRRFGAESFQIAPADKLNYAT